MEAKFTFIKQDNHGYYAKFNHSTEKLELNLDMANEYAEKGDVYAKAVLAIYEKGVKSVDKKIENHLKDRKQIRKAAFNEFKIKLHQAYENSGYEDSKLGEEILKILDSTD